MSAQRLATDWPEHPLPPRGPELFALGSAVRELRARRRLSQERLGVRAGMHRNYIGAIERGQINPTFHIMLKLTQGLCIPMSELVAIYERHRTAIGPDQQPRNRCS